MARRTSAVAATEYPELLTTEDVARILRVSKPTLALWRSKNEGPRWIKVGRVVRYPKTDFDAWYAALASGGEKVSA